MNELQPLGEEVLAKEHTLAPTPEARRGFAESYKAFLRRNEVTDEVQASEVKPNRVGGFISRLAGRRGEVVEPPPEVEPPLPLDLLPLENLSAEALVYQRSAVESAVAQPEVAPEPQTSIEVPGQRPERQPEAVEVSIERVSTPETSEQQESAEEHEAAEEKLGEEGQRERSHEIKKDQLNTDDGGLAATMGEALSQLHEKALAAHTAFKHKIPQVSKPQLSFAAQPPLYKRAILGGFGLAVVILLGFSVIR